MLIRLGAGPAVSASDLRLLRRLLGLADWWALPTGLVQSRQATSAAGGSCRLLITVVVLLMMQAWSWGRGNSPAAWRAITVATPHLFLINGARAPGEGSADSRRVRLAVLPPSPEVSLAGGPCCPQAVQTSRRGRRTRYSGADVRAGWATVPCRREIFPSTARCSHACPW